MKPYATLLPLLGLLLAAAAPVRAEAPAIDDDHIRRVVHVCAACHGEGGASKDAAFPRLAAQPADYVTAQLEAFRGEKRAERDGRAYMWGVSALLDDATIHGLAEYYQAQPAAPGISGKSALIARGEKIFVDGIAAKGVRPCAGCHGSGGEGATVFPRLAGQHASYVLNQLRLFRTRLRPHGTLMANETRSMSQEELRAVAEYVQSR